MHKPTTREVYGMRERGKPEYVNDTAEMRVAGGDNRWNYLDRDDANSNFSRHHTRQTLNGPAYLAYQKTKEDQTKAHRSIVRHEKHISKFASDEDLMARGTTKYS